MLYSAKTLKGYALHSRDGVIGSTREFYFDDNYWTVRYLVAETGSWLSGRKVLISPYSLLNVSSAKREIHVSLTKKQIEDSPDLESHKPVSRQFEDNYYGHYGWPVYWGGPYSWGPYPYASPEGGGSGDPKSRDKSWEPKLRSTHVVGGYKVDAADGYIGHIEDFILDDETWALRYLVIDTRNWLAGRKVLVSPQWIENISWEDSTVVVNLSREAVRNSPEFTDALLISRNYEIGLHGHYNREGYWVKDLVRH
jgi:hypothetical protein